MIINQWVESLKNDPLIQYDSFKHTWVRYSYLCLISDQSRPKYFARVGWVLWIMTFHNQADKRNEFKLRKKKNRFACWTVNSGKGYKGENPIKTRFDFPDYHSLVTTNALTFKRNIWINHNNTFNCVYVHEFSITGSVSDPATFLHQTTWSRV